MRISYYPGCVAKGTCPELHQSTLKVAQILGIDLVELTDWACCGAGVVTEADPDLALAINARTFAQAERLGLDLMTICGTCQGVMASANRQLKEDEALCARINRIIVESGGVEYRGTIEVKHLLWVLVQEMGMEKLKKYVRRPLRGLRVAPFYGCYILRPSWNLGFDDPENPTSLEKVISTIGAEPVEYSGRTKCCGFPILLEKEEISLGMVAQNIGEAQREGADCMVTPCPLCHISLDIHQEKAAELTRVPLSTPIFHLPQLVALALGVDAKDLGLSRHLVPVWKAIEKITGRGGGT